MADANADHADDKATTDVTPTETSAELTPEEQIVGLKKDLDESRGKEKALSSKLGTQSNQIGELKKFADEMENNPKGLSQRICDGAGIKVNFDTQPAIGAEIEGLQPEQVGKLVQDISSGVKAELEPTIKGAQDAHTVFNEQILANRYPDFDERAPERDSLKLAVASGGMSISELRHLAARGSMMEEAVAAAVQKGADEKLAELNKKAEEQISGGGTTSKDKAKGHTAESAADRLNRVRGR